MKRLRDPRLWVGLGVTALALWLSFRDVSWPALGRDLARANWWLLIGASLPAYVAAIWLRALRWRVLARGVADFDTGAAFRATAVGFMVNNLLPLRVGELVRVWWLARETRASASALLGTVILERVIDAVFLLALASLVIGSEVGRGVFFAARGGAARRVPRAAALARRRGGAGRARRRALPRARARRAQCGCRRLGGSGGRRAARRRRRRARRAAQRAAVGRGGRDPVLGGAGVARHRARRTGGAAAGAP